MLGGEILITRFPAKIKRITEGRSCLDCSNKLPSRQPAPDWLEAQSTDWERSVGISERQFSFRRVHKRSHGKRKTRFRANPRLLGN